MASTGSPRGQKAAEMLEESGAACQRGAAREQRRLQRAQRSADRAAPERAMVSALSENEGGAGGRARSSHPLLSRQHWEKVYAQWLENIQDWCISRQIWWGHRIPAWYCGTGDGNATCRRRVRRDPENWQQDPDTLDTWFSSWLWAYETMDAETRQKFYPTSVLVTAPDIIFFWVARMIIAGLGIQAGQDPIGSKTTSRFAMFFSRDSFATSRAARCRNRWAIRPIRSI